MKNLGEREVSGVNRMLQELCLIFRWSSVLATDKYNELTKQALNSIFTFILATMAKENGINIDMTLFPKIAIYRAFQKLIQCDITEKSIDAICSFNLVSREQFNDLTKQHIDDLTSKDFREFLQIDSGSLEMRIFKVATRLATLMECRDLETFIPKNEYTQTMMEILNDITKYYDIPGVKELENPDSNIYKFISKIAQLRNRTRWTKHCSLVKCNVLGHMFDTAIFAYLMALEKNEDEELATRYFFIGIFHDCQEAWTGDMPSPIKRRIPGLTKSTELYERECLEKFAFPTLPDYMRTALKKVMLEYEHNAHYKSLIKTADYFSADAECWRQVIAGSRDPYFSNLIKKDYDEKKDLLPAFEQLLKEMILTVI